MGRLSRLAGLLKGSSGLLNVDEDIENIKSVEAAKYRSRPHGSFSFYKKSIFITFQYSSDIN